MMKIAIVGAGPAGLTIAYFLKYVGYNDIDVYEADNKIGGQSESLHLHKESGYINEVGTVFSTLGYATVHKIMKNVNVTLIKDAVNGLIGYMRTDGTTEIIGSRIHLLFEIESIKYFLFIFFNWLRFFLGFMSKEEQATIYSEWLKEKGRDEKNLSEVSRIGSHGQLYGPLNEITVRNSFEWVIPSLIVSGVFLKIYRVKEGHQTFWERVVKKFKINVITGSKIKDTEQLKENYDHVFVTCPLDEITTPITPIINGPFDDTNVLSVYVKIPKGSWTYDFENYYLFDSPKSKTIKVSCIYPKYHDKVNEDIVVILAMVNKKEMGLLLYETVREFTDITGIDVKVEDVIYHKIFRYGVRYSPRQILSGLPQKINRAQGKDNVWYSGGALTHWNISAITNFNLFLVMRFALRQSIFNIKVWLMFLTHFPVWENRIE